METDNAPHWPACLRLAVTGLRLTPEVFWRLSWREWAWLTAPPAHPSLPPEALQTLMRLFPDDDIVS